MNLMTSHAADWAKWAADDLIKNRGRSVVMPGRSQAASVHALAAAINHLLDNDTETVKYRPMSRPPCVERRFGPFGGRGRRAGSLTTLVTIGANPVFTAPADLNFAEAVARVPVRIHLGDADETARRDVVPRSHPFPRGGTTPGANGTRSITQPMIKPLYDYHLDLELLAAILGSRIRMATRSCATRWSRRSVRVRWTTFRRALHDGIVPETRETVQADRSFRPAGRRSRARSPLRHRRSAPIRTGSMC